MQIMKPTIFIVFLSLVLFSMNATSNVVPVTQTTDRLLTLLHDLHPDLPDERMYDDKRVYKKSYEMIEVDSSPDFHLIPNHTGPVEAILLK